MISSEARLVTSAMGYHAASLDEEYIPHIFWPLLKSNFSVVFSYLGIAQVPFVEPFSFSVCIKIVLGRVCYKTG